MRTVVQESQRASAAGGVVYHLGHHGTVFVEEQLVANTDLTCRLYEHVPQPQFFVQLPEQEYLNLCIRLLLGAKETGRKHLGVVEHHGVAFIEIVDDMAEGDKLVGIIAFLVLLEHLDSLAFPVDNHHAAFVAAIDFLHSAVFVLKGTIGRLHCHQFVGQLESEL